MKVPNCYKSLFTEKYKPEPPRTLQSELSEANNKVNVLRSEIERLQIIYDGIGGVPDQWKCFNWHDYLINNLQRITLEINTFLKEYK